MAISTKTKEYIALEYAKYFGKTPTDAQIAKYAEFGKAKLISNEIKINAGLKNAKMSKDEQIHDLYNNLFGRDAVDSELTKYKVKYLDKGKPLPINSIIKAAKKGSSDKAVYDTKKAVALFIAEKGSTTNIDLDKITEDTYKEIFDGKKLTITTVAQLEAKVDAMEDNVTGQTFILTTGIDTMPGLVGSAGTTGTDGNDTINAIVDGTGTTQTLTPLDTINGGAGNDTLNILNADATAAALPAGITVSNVETVNVRSANDVGATGSAFDVSGFTGTTTLNVTQAEDVNVKAAATTDINVTATGAIEVYNGKDVAITNATTAQAITVGGTTTTNPAGKITVTDTDNSGANAIKVYGGTDVTVTATTKATSTGDIVVGDTIKGTATGNVVVTQNLNSDGVATAIAADAIAVTGGKTVTVTQNANSTATVETASTGITTSTVVVTADDKTTDVTVKAIANITNVTRDAVDEVKGTAAVTFKAVAAGDIVTVNSLVFTAAKDLTAAEVAQAFANLTATDTQSTGGITTNGIYTAALAANFTSGAANGATVVFTNTAAGTAAPTMTITATDSGSNAKASALPSSTPTTGTAAVTYLKSTNGVTYNTVDIKDNGTASIQNISVDGATTVSLGNTGSLNALKTLSLANVSGATGITSAVSTLDMTLNKVSGVITLNAALTSLNLNSTGAASTSAIASTTLKNLTIDAAAALNVSGGTMMSTTPGLENITVKGTSAVTLGTVASTALKSFDAAANTGGVKATINAATAGSHADLKTFVFSAGKDAVTIATKDINKAINLGAGDDTINFDATTVVLADVTGTIDGGAGTDTIHMGAAFAVLATASTSTFDTQISNFEKLSLGTLGANSAVDLAKIDNISYVISANNAAFLLTLNNMANNGTLELASGAAATNDTTVVMKDASGTADTFNIITNVDGSDLNMGTVTVAGVETINVTAKDISPVDAAGVATISEATLELTAAAAKTINVKGDSDIDLTLTSSTKVTMIDGSAMTGALTATTGVSTSAATIKGGSGDDELTATHDNDVLIGGKGADTLTVASGNLVQLHGGEGKDTYVIGATGNQNAYATINGTKAELSGDVIQFAGLNGFNDAKIVLGDTAVFQDYVNEAAKGNATSKASYFVWAGNTYLVQDNGGALTFTNGTDSIVKIAGVVDFTFNATTNVLEIA